MNIQSFMSDLITIYRNAEINKPSAVVLREQLKTLTAQFNKSSPLVRDRYAFDHLYNVLSNDFQIRCLSLAYEYNGILYITHKDAPRDRSTDALHDLQLTMATWHQMKKFTVYHDFTIYDDFILN